MSLKYSLINDATDDTITYIFLGSRLYPFSLDEEEIQTDENSRLVSTNTNVVIALDVVTSLKTSWNADLSKYPVSSGSEVSDHLSIRNNTYTLEGIVSDTPFVRYKNELFGKADGPYFRALYAVEALKKLYQAKRVFTFFSENEKVENVVITKVDYEQLGQEAVAFTIEFEEVRFAYAKTVTLNVKKATKKSVASNKNGGGASKVQAQSQTDYEKKLKDAKTLNEANN